MAMSFDKCVEDGGRVRTLSLPDNKFQRLCFLGGKTFSDGIKTKKKK